jgi:hypothetical protein
MAYIEILIKIIFSPNKHITELNEVMKILKLKIKFDLNEFITTIEIQKKFKYLN